ncbi:MAG TPA: helix-turn-helix domain-containing protein [Gemmatimonadaceae bacterium]|jgi:putative transcriptional regulator|nr:helix-turn-helix domain-containing protein [Gemmatimonadaceae bacterium]
MAKSTTKSIGEQIIEGLEEAVAYERGKLSGVRTKVVTARTVHAAPPPRYTSRKIAKLRKNLSLSQPVFAMALNVSPATVRAWEQGQREPDGATTRLLQIFEKQPRLVLDSIRSRE